MYRGKRLIAIIPARGGSKRIPHKNIVLLGGKPMIYYTIKSALAARFLDRVVVSTDDPAIARIAKRAGAEVPFLRPANISGDAAPDKPVIEHCLDFFKKRGEKFDAVVWLRPTAPFRTVENITKTIEALYRGRADVARTMTPVAGVFHPFWMYKTVGSLLKPFAGVPIDRFTRGQALPQNIVRLNGVVDAVKTSWIPRSKFVFSAPRMAYTLIPESRALDIDYPHELALAEFLMRHKKFLNAHV